MLPPPVGAALVHVVPLLVKTLPEVLGATKVGEEVPAPRITLLEARFPNPVPPEVTPRTLDNEAAEPLVFWFKIGKVQLVRFPLDGVPSAPAGTR